jgi:acyl-CoA dehydrogenase
MSLRKKIVTSFKGVLPRLSRTEKEALESGTVGWDGELMKGTPDWDVLFKLHKPELTAEEQAFLDGPCEELCKMIDNTTINKEGDLPREIWDFIRDKGFMGLEIPKEFGGHGFSSSAHSAIVIKLASRSITAAVTVMVPNSLGPAELIHAYGTKEQQDYYLPRLANGTEIPCFALTEPEAGSDAGNISACGIVCKGENGELGIRLNWEKRYITLGPVATLIGLAFKLEDPDNLLGRNETDIGITCALVPRNTPGVEIGDRHAPMDLPFQNGPNKGKDVFIPLDNIIGGPERAGHGWRMLMECLAVGRALSLPALSTAGAKLSSYATGAYARIRRQFNTSISRFEGIEEPLGKMAALTYMMDAARAATLRMVDEGERPAIPSAILKYHLTEKMRTIVNDAMDIHGGKAIINGPRNIFADLYKGIPVAITVEGANIMTRNLIIFGQGSVRAHPYILKELAATDEPDGKKAFSTLFKTLAKHVGNTFRSLGKAFVYGFTGGWLSRTPKDTDKAMRKYYRQINRLSAAFNLCADATLGTLGGGLKIRERVSARLGDVFSNLYLASTTLWYYEKMGRRPEDAPLVNWACTHALHEAEQAIDKALKNHPSRLVGALLQPVIFPRMIFPFFKKTLVSPPSDKMDVLAADTIRNPGAARDHLTNGIFKPQDEREQLGKLEAAFKACIESEPLEKKIHKAQKAGTLSRELSRTELLIAAQKADVLTLAECDAIRRADALRLEIVTVDAHTPDKRSGAFRDETPAKTAAGPKVA